MRPRALLLLYTARPEFRAPWTPRAHHTQITLNRLGARDIRTMVAQVAASKALSDETIETVVERTGGVPLFVEELTRAVLESGGAKLTGREIPATLHDSLMARLDRLGPAKEVAQVAAVIGREFSYELLHAVHPIAERNLQQRAAHAGRCGIAVRSRHRSRRDLSVQARADSGCGLRGAAQEPPQGTASDSSRAPSTEQFPALKEAHPEVLAHHWTEAGEIEPAITAWTSEVRSAAAHHAYREAEQHYRDALAACINCRNHHSATAANLECRWLWALCDGCHPRIVAIETDRAYPRGRSLTEHAGGDIDRSIPSVLQARRRITRGDCAACVGMIADRMLESLATLERPRTLAVAHYVQVTSAHHLGDLAGARQHFALAQSLSRRGFQKLFGRIDQLLVH